MPKHRLKLHEILCSALGDEHCYFQPPESVKLSYPCIIYKYDNNVVFRADDAPYLVIDTYVATFITRNPEDPVIDKLSWLPNTEEGKSIELQIRFDRYFVADNLHHYSYIVRTT